MSYKNYEVWDEIETPVGTLTLTASASGLSGLFFPGRGPAVTGRERCPERFEQAVEQLNEYFAGARREFELELDLSGGTSFQQRVWTELLTIPYGRTISYGQLATRLGSPGHMRAVGSANGANPVSIIAPCHRVIGADGKLTGYGGGLPRKRALLGMEAAVLHGRPVSISLEPAQLSLV